jgi:hypothetical protein
VRRARLVDCDPRWARAKDGVTGYISFDCPEGHDCRHVVPFTPALDGSAHVPGGAVWTRGNETAFEALSLSPSIKVTPRYGSREEAIADGCDPEHVTSSLLCAMHVNLVNGAFEFANDSR